VPRSRAAAGVVAAIAIAFAAAGCAHRPTPAATPQPPATPTPKPLAVDPLNGELVDPAALKHRVSAVMIDNYPIDARPQSGLHDAEIVYEVEAEGGITRYMALYLAHTPSKIGPVRSTRTYFVNLARPYDPLFAHAGENDDVWEPLKELRASGFADMEEIVGTPEAFWRDDTRDMPHNLYTSIARMRKSAPDHGWPDTPFTASALRFDDPPQPVASATPVVETVATAPPKTVDSFSVGFWLNYSVEFRRDGDGFERIINGVVQHDLDDARPYRVADVVVVWVPARVLDSLGDLAMDVYGDFPAAVVRTDGVTQARWEEPGPNDLPYLSDASGESIALIPGQIYIEYVPQGGRLDVGKLHISY
jgi:DUF3048 family protein